MFHIHSEMLLHVAVSAPFARWRQDPEHLHLYSDIQVQYMCTDLLATLQTASRPFASVSIRCARNQFPHHSLQVDSCHCMWNYVRQSYGLIYYSLHYTRNSLLVTSQPITQNMLMTANYYTIRLQYCERFRVSPTKCSCTWNCIYVIMEGVFGVCVCVCVSVCLWQPLGINLYRTKVTFAVTQVKV
jgi:hypothetical protein